jgi:hypothetical protein
MKIVTTPDGMISVIELDPTKKHFIIADGNAMGVHGWEMLARNGIRDGMIILKRPGTEIQIIEGDELPEVKEAP